jgi:hypothetical protein
MAGGGLSQVVGGTLGGRFGRVEPKSRASACVRLIGPRCPIVFATLLRPKRLMGTALGRGPATIDRCALGLQTRSWCR